MDYSFNIYWSTIAYLPSMYSRLKNGIEASVANGRRKQLVLKHFKYNTTTYYTTLFEVSKTLNCFSIDQKRTPSILNNLVTSKKTFCLLFQCTFAQQMWSKMELFFFCSIQQHFIFMNFTKIIPSNFKISQKIWISIWKVESPPISYLLIYLVKSSKNNWHSKLFSFPLSTHRELKLISAGWLGLRISVFSAAQFLKKKQSSGITRELINFARWRWKVSQLLLLMMNFLWVLDSIA